LKAESKNEAREMENFYTFMSDSPESPEKEEQDPKKMDQNNNIRRDFIKHPFFPR
jgi:hypothetical protein